MYLLFRELGFGIRSKESMFSRMSVFGKCSGHFKNYNVVLSFDMVYGLDIIFSVIKLQTSLHNKYP